VRAEDVDDQELRRIRALMEEAAAAESGSDA